jgi:hypothetical protein
MRASFGGGKKHQADFTGRYLTFFLPTQSCNTSFSKMLCCLPTIAYFGFPTLSLAPTGPLIP